MDLSQRSQTYDCMNPMFQQPYLPQNIEQQQTVYKNQTYEELPVTSPRDFSPRTSTTVNSNNGNGRHFSFTAWPSQKIIMTGINKKTKCCIATPIVLVLVVGLLLCGVAVLTVFTYLDLRSVRSRLDQLDTPLAMVEGIRSDVATTNQEVVALMNTIRQLEHQLNETEDRYRAQIAAIQDLVNTSDVNRDLMQKIKQLEQQLNETEDRYQAEVSELGANTCAAIQQLEQQLNKTEDQYRSQISELQMNISGNQGIIQSSIDALQADTQSNTGQLDSLRSKLDALNVTQGEFDKVLSSTNMLINSTNYELSTLQMSVWNLTDRFNSSIDLYQSCIQETESCTLSTNGSSTSYWSACKPSSIATDRTGYYTTDMRCEYESGYNLLDTSVLRKSGSSVECQCQATLISSGAHIPLPSDMSGTCTLVVTRCPTTLILP